MKRFSAIAIFAIANLALAGHSFAQSNRVQATVPFNFTVGDKTLPAGTYSIKSASSSSSVIVIRNHDKPIAMVASVMQDGKTAPGGGYLVFHKYGDRYFLSEILSDAADMNLMVPLSKTEKKTRLEEARLSTPSQTLVAAR
jgi:hypothetical protein